MPTRLLKPGGTARGAEPSQIYQQMADALPHMLWTALPDGTLEYVNARILSYTGIPAKELLAGRWKPVYHPEEFELCVRRWRRALASGRSFEAEYRLRRADGEYRWHAHSVLALRDANGQIVKWFGTCTDIDDLKKAAQRLERARRALEAMVMARGDLVDAGKSSPFDQLSEREQQVLQLIVDGRTSAEVGERLGLSPKSIDTYRSRLMAKLGIEDLPTLVKFAIRHGLTTIG
ncbi:MAG TPA: PAS domain-containing protein [Burkholderiales bacterium]|jgi:PAS domain S-box-containing protein